MKDMILAELRRSWKGRRILAAFAAFLCFFSVVYALSLQKAKSYEDDLIIQLHNQNTIIGTRCGDLMHELQFTPNNQENRDKEKKHTAGVKSMIICTAGH